MTQTRKLNILLADDQPADIKIVKDILNAEGSVLKDHHNILVAYFAKSIPDEYKELYDEKYIATRIIENQEYIDLALIDVVFEDEFNSTSSEGAEIIIKEIKQKFTRCPIGLLSNNAGGIFLNQAISFSNSTYPVIGKRPNKIKTKTYDEFFNSLLNKWLRTKLSQIDKANKINELLGKLANPHESLESTISFNNETWKLIDLFFFVSKHDKKVIQDKISDFLVTMPRLRQLRNQERSLVFFENKNNEWGIPFSELFQSYYTEYSFITGNSFLDLAEQATSYVQKVFAELCQEKKETPDIGQLLSFTETRLATAIPRETKITHAIVPIFKDKLIKRMATLDLYCFLGLSGTGINYLLNKNDDSLGDNHTRNISKYIGISIKDQLSTKVDFLIYDFSTSDKNRKEKKQNLRKLSNFERSYDFQVKHCGSYEKKHLLAMNDYFSKNTCHNTNCIVCKAVKENINFIESTHILFSNN